uniref:Dynein light chain n=1 Tax=Canis lupus familiaris TaxID=9615 RepID=A0A8C0NI89_CANLF
QALRKLPVLTASLSEEMQQDSVECATQALEKYNKEKDIAAHIKKDLRLYLFSIPYLCPMFFLLKIHSFPNKSVGEKKN